MLGNVAFTVIPTGVWVWYLPQLQCCHVRPPLWVLCMALDKYRRWKTWKCIAIAIALCHLKNTPRHIDKNRELKQWGRERRRERYKTIDLIQYRIQSLHVGMPWNATTWFICHENKRNVGICWKKVWLVSNWTQHMLTSCNIAQHGVQTNAIRALKLHWGNTEGGGGRGWEASSPLHSNSKRVSQWDRSLVLLPPTPPSPPPPSVLIY